MYQALKVAWQVNPKGKNGPPIPLILGGWNFSGDYEKKAVWEATIKWAEDMGFDQLIPELTDEQCYFVTSMQSYSCPSEFWNYHPREKPEKAAIDTALEKLKVSWPIIAGEELAQITIPLCFTGKKSRRLLVFADLSFMPSWGTWTKKSSGIEGKAFTVFRRKINDVISPLEIDHIDFTDTKIHKNKMKITFEVSKYPPKKDGANSMWRKGSE